MSYSSDPRKLKNIFKNINERKLVLPNFQREFVWSKNQQKSLLSSFFVKLPIGSFLFLEGPKREYPSKKIGKKNSIINYEDINFENVSFLLDGQQRVTTLKSIFSNLYENLTEKKEFKKEHKDSFNTLRLRWFIDIETEEFKDFFGLKNLKFDENRYKHVEPQDIQGMFKYEKVNRSKGNEKKWYNPLYRIENGLGIDEYKKIVIENGAKESLIPLFYLTETQSVTIYDEEINSDDTVIYKILEKISSYEFGNDRMKAQVKWVSSVYNYLKKILDVSLHIIKVPLEEKGRAIPIFEHINSGGTALDTFDLIVAKAADKKGNNYEIYKDNKESLREAITRKMKNNIDKEYFNVYKTFDMGYLPIKWKPSNLYFDSKNEMYNEFKTRYLSILSLVANLDDLNDLDNIASDFLKKSKALDLNSHQINFNTNSVIDAIIDSGLFLQFRCGIVTINDLSYKLMLVPVAYVMLNKNKHKFNFKEVLNILEVWYWFSIFTGTYRDNKNKRSIQDINLLYEVIINRKIDKFEEFINEYKNRLFNFEDYSDYKTLITNNEVPKAIERTIKQYILSKCPNDMMNKSIRLNSWESNLKLEYHHLIPLGSDFRNKINNSRKNLRKNKNHILNSPLNYTPLTKDTNNKISNISIENYFKYVSKLSKDKHLLPDDIFVNSKNIFGTRKFYKKFLEMRLNKINDRMQSEFQNLLSNLPININFS